MDQIQPLAPNCSEDAQEQPLPLEEKQSIESESPLPSTSNDQSDSMNVVPKKRTEEKKRRRDSRSWESKMKLVADQDEAGKLAFIEEKYNELNTELKTTKQNFHILERQCIILKKEKDQMQSERAKGILIRSRLENLCRELQKQNKQIKDENMAKIKEEEELRKEVSAKFAGKLNDINSLMEESKGKSEKLREENKLMTTKLTELYDEFQKREHDITKMTREMEIERQYFRAQLEKMELEITAEKQGLLKEHALMQSSLEKSEANCQILMNTIKGLQNNIDLYKAQYEDFESTMTKSNAIFDTFKSEMDVLSQQAQVFEHEAKSWKNKWQESATALLELTKTKQIQDTIIQTSEKKINQLQKLCRQLQVDRAAFLKLLKDNNIEATTQICYEKEPKTAKKTKLSKKEQELEILKSNLKVLQNELNIAQREEIHKEANQESESIEKANETGKENQENIPDITKLDINQLPQENSSLNDTVIESNDQNVLEEKTEIKQSAE